MPMLLTITGGCCMAYERGDVLLVPFPFSDLTATKVRPAIVVSSDTYHSTEPDLILAALTTNLVQVKSTVDYALKGWKAAGLKYPSAFKPVVFTLDPDRVIHHVGALNKSDLKEVDQRLKRALGL